MELSVYPVEKPEGMNVIIGQLGCSRPLRTFIEALAGAGAQLRFGIAFSEARALPHPPFG